MKKQFLILFLLVATALNAQEEGTEISSEATEATPEIVAEGTPSPTEATEATPEITTNTNDIATNDTVTPMYVSTVGYTITNGDHLYASPNARFEVQGVDEQSGLKEILVSIDGSSYAPYKEPIGFTKEGEHSLSYQFIDRVGNVSYSKVFSLILDATAPRVSELVLSPAPYFASGIEYVGPNTEVSFRAYDDMTGVAYIEYAAQDKPMTRFETNTTLSNLGFTTTAPVAFSFQVTDMVSNVSPIKTRSLYVDATAPNVDVFAKAVEVDGIRYISSRDTIYVEAYDDNTIVEDVFYSVNGEEFQLYDEQIGINLKNAGEYTILAKATDVVGNESEAVEYKVNVDMLAPTGDVMYIGEVRSSTSTEATTNETVTTNETSTTEVQATESASENSVELTELTEATPASEESSNPTSDELPAGTAVDAMVTEETVAE